MNQNTNIRLLAENKPDFPIKTERLLIASIRSEDTEEISKQNTADGLNTYLLSLTKEEIEKALSNVDEVQSVLDRMNDIKRAPIYETYGAWYEGKLIGFASFLVCQYGTMEIQIEVLPEYQHKGFGFELLSNVLRTLFAHNHSICFRYTVIPNNKASIAVAEKLGAQLQAPQSAAEKMLLRTYLIRDFEKASAIE